MSAIGRIPSTAAPTAAPAIAFSLIGVSMIRSCPNSSTRPEIDAERAAEPAFDADVLADQEHALVGAHLLGDRLAQRLADRQPPRAGGELRHRRR